MHDDEADAPFEAAEAATQVAQTDVMECDTLIIGASLAGNCLARQLKLKHPDMRIVVLERKQAFSYWVGESTLEVFWDYCVRYLDLGHYLHTNHLYKHGLRWFFDSPERSLTLPEMSEMGRTWYHGMPASQLDRKRFDEDLVAMNRQAGVTVRMGERVTDIEIDREQGHVVRTPRGVYRCRWLVDAGGFAAPLGKKLGVTEVEAKLHPVRSHWGRFRHIRNMDTMGDQEWRGKVHHTSRYLSTNHFMYPGYWIWVIPVDNETTSIGVTVQENMRGDIKITNEDELLAFLRTHRVFRDLLPEPIKAEDYCALVSLPRRSYPTYSEDRWFITGMAAGLIEAMFSYTSAAIADNNRFIGELIAADEAGDSEVFRQKLKVFNAYTKLRWELVLSMTKGQYSGSYDIHRMHYQPIAMGYFGIMLPRSMAEKWTFEKPEDVARLSADELYQRGAMMLFGKDCIYTLLHARRDEFEQYLAERGDVLTNNSGQFFDSRAPEPFIHQIMTSGKQLDGMALLSLQEQMYYVCIEYSLRRMAALEGLMPTEATHEDVVRRVMRERLTLRQGLALLGPQRAAAMTAGTMAPGAMLPAPMMTNGAE
jgi:tetracycline 7-halogenase / FADH2 O2-dependent halogenase